MGTLVKPLGSVFSEPEGFRRLFEQEMPEEMSVFVTSTTTERHMFIVNSLDPFKVIMEETYRVRESFG